MMEPFSAEIKTLLIDTIEDTVKCVSCKDEFYCPKVMYFLRLKLNNNPGIEGDMQLSCICSDCLPEKLVMIEQGLLKSYRAFVELQSTNPIQNQSEEKNPPKS